MEPESVGEVELRYANGNWEFGQSDGQVYYIYEGLDPTIGQWDSSCALPNGLGSLPAPCVRPWLAEQKWAQEAQQQSQETTDVVPLDRIRWNLLPRYARTFDGSQATFCVSEGILQQFSGDAILAIDISGTWNGLKFPVGRLDSQPEVVAGYTLRCFEGGQLPATWCFCATLEGALPNQPGGIGAGGTLVAEDLQEVLQLAMQRIRSKGALSMALSMVELSNQKSSDDPSSDTSDTSAVFESLAAVMTHAIFDAGDISESKGTEKTSLEIHLLVDSVLPVLSSRRAIEKVVAKRSRSDDGLGLPVGLTKHWYLRGILKCWFQGVPVPVLEIQKKLPSFRSVEF